MKINFFETECQEAPRTDSIFGICDGEDGEKAYTNIENRVNWIATVKNEAKISIRFTTIDNCLNFKKEGTNDEESTCDGMLTYDQHLYLLELKNQITGGWKPEAFDQLENTIRLIKQDPKIDNFKYKKAFACNKKRKYPRFNTTDSERNKRFFTKYGFRIGIQVELIIKP